MMPKSTLIAPAGVGGQIHASASGKNYDISADGTVVVDANDVAALLNAGYQHVPPGKDHRARGPGEPPITSDAYGSQDTGASALDPDKREANHRPPPSDTGQENHDHGDAIPPHGENDEGASTDATRADASQELLAAMKAGVDTGESHVANTGHMGIANSTGADQAAVREKLPGGERETDGPKPADKDGVYHVGHDAKPDTDAGKMPPEGDHHD